MALKPNKKSAIVRMPSNAHCLVGSAAIACILLSGCTSGGSETYTLYRNSPIDTAMRIHVASFDADGSVGYNQTNCLLAEKLFMGQPGVTVRFWCEKGRYRP